ncbi:MAG: hypothetical protein ACP5SH_24950 [Syntrophobacteraceae bacterium]
MPQGIKQLTLRIPKEMHDVLDEISHNSKRSGEFVSMNTIGIEALQLWLETHEVQTSKITKHHFNASKLKGNLS